MSALLASLPMTIRLEDLADQIAADLNSTVSTAQTLRAVTTYAAQLEVPGTGETWWCPDVEVDDETAEHIRQAYAAGAAAERSTR